MNRAERRKDSHVRKEMASDRRTDFVIFSEL